jgi:hypothetical protein
MLTAKASPLDIKGEERTHELPVFWIINPS